MGKKQQAVITCRGQAAELCLCHDPTPSSQQSDYCYCPQRGGLSYLNPKDYTFAMACDQHNEKNQALKNRHSYIIILLFDTIDCYTLSNISLIKVRGYKGFTL